jgi:PHD/YefM family antitoxin component YafN of YafNO toxin-antitoxin module
VEDEVKPRLTVAVRRGLKEIAMLAESDLDADQSTTHPRLNKQEAEEVRKALRWIGHLDTKGEQE